MMIRLERYLRSIFECIASISQLLKKNLYDVGPMQATISDVGKCRVLSTGRVAAAWVLSLQRRAIAA